jgi:hypothetical protein
MFHYSSTYGLASTMALPPRFSQVARHGGGYVHNAGFTTKERALLEKLLELIDRGLREDLATKAAIELKISPVTVRSRLSRMRSKYRDAKGFMAEYRGWQQRLYQRSGGKFHSL